MGYDYDECQKCGTLFDTYTGGGYCDCGNAYCESCLNYIIRICKLVKEKDRNFIDRCGSCDEEACAKVKIEGVSEQRIKQQARSKEEITSLCQYYGVVNQKLVNGLFQLITKSNNFL